MGVDYQAPSLIHSSVLSITRAVGVQNGHPSMQRQKQIHWPAVGMTTVMWMGQKIVPKLLHLFHFLGLKWDQALI